MLLDGWKLSLIIIVIHTVVLIILLVVDALTSA
jgi:hypothetical protein